MEKDNRIGRFAVHNKIIIASAGLATVLAVSGDRGLASGRLQTSYTPLSEDHFKSLVLPDENIVSNEVELPDKSVIIFPSKVPETPKPSSEIKNVEVKVPEETKGEKLLTKYLKEEKKIITQMKTEGVSSKIIADVKMYYPIYKAIADHYKIDWVSIMVTHEGESSASRSKRAFNGGSAPYFGAGQRDTNQWSNGLVNKKYHEVFGSIPEFSKLHTRNKSDIKELAFVGDYLNRNYDHSINNGLSKDKALFNSFRLYTASSSLAEKRLLQTRRLDEIVALS